MKANRILVGFGAAAMALSSVAASAGTRASDVSVVNVQPAKLSAVSGDVVRSTESAKRQSELGGAGLIIAILAGIAVVAGVVIAADDDDDRSPGG